MDSKGNCRLIINLIESSWQPAEQKAVLLANLQSVQYEALDPALEKEKSDP
jgi:hypothetical protein